MKNTIHLDKSGAFLLRGPTKITMSLNRELVVVLSVPLKKTCGVILFHPEEDLKMLSQSLETLYERMNEALSVEAKEIQVKIFGLRTGTRSVLERLYHWLDKNHLNIFAKDISGNTCRTLTIDCATGMVGVGYSEKSSPGQLQLLSEGTARDRYPTNDIQSEVLILTENPVRRTLARQALEEFPNWRAATPQSPSKILTKKNLSDFPWSVVLIFDDIDDEKLIEVWINRVGMNFRQVQFRWVGAAIPSHLKRSCPELKLLPPLEPSLLPEFKRQLRNAVFEYTISETNDLLQFRKKRKG